MAPEYVMHGHFSVKSDVFSFGVLVLEIISGRKNSCFRNGEEAGDLLTYVSKSYYNYSFLTFSTIRWVTSWNMEIISM